MGGPLDMGLQLWVNLLPLVQVNEDAWAFGKEYWYCKNTEQGFSSNVTKYNTHDIDELQSPAISEISLWVLTEENFFEDLTN